MIRWWFVYVASCAVRGLLIFVGDAICLMVCLYGVLRWVIFFAAFTVDMEVSYELEDHDPVVHQRFVSSVRKYRVWLPGWYL